MPTMIMPKMGDGMEEGTLLRWLKSVGEEIEVGDPIAEIETDKVSLEIEATEAGTLTQTMVGEGETVPIGTAIALIGEEAAGEASLPPQPEAAPAAVATPGNAETTMVDPAVERATAGNEGAEASSAPIRGTTADVGAATRPTGGSNGAADGHATTQAQEPQRGPGERLRASPLVKRLAAEHGLDLTGIAGTGPGGRIVKDDVMPYVNGTAQLPARAAEPAATPAASPEEQPDGGTAQPVAAPPQGQTAPRPAAQAPAPGCGRLERGGRPAGVAKEMSRIRRTTGRRMTESKQAIPHFYVVSEVDMGAAAAFREQVNAQVVDDATKISFNDMIVKAAALALREYPNLNTTLEGDTLFTHENIDVNVAVAIEGGLIAPFVADADTKSLGAIARTTKDIIGRARKGGLEPAEFQGGTFTVSNLGMYDVEEFVAIINPPQAAILAIGSIAETPVVKDGELAIGKRMKITLSADHRVTDGAEVAQFLMRVKASLENPVVLAVS
jgi:pyruvate dehydrogenase E2 component (dihydrolipoamide acetyltransferase)